ncbi:MAG: ABC transporter permease subunit [Acidobacteriota bacterium]
MLWHLIKKEYRSNLLSLKFIISFALLIILMIISVSLHSRLYQEGVSDYNSRTMAHKMSLNFLPNYEMLGFAGIALDKKPYPLSIFAQGLDQGANKISRVGLMTFPRLNVGSGGNPLFYTTRTLDYLFIIKIIASLLAILFAYNAVSGEKEGRTLNLTLSNSLPRSTFLLGKYIGGFSSLLTLLVFAFASGLLITNLHPYISFTGGEWMRIGMIFLFTLLYLGFFFALGMLVSVLTSRSVITLFVLLFLWVLIVFAIPYFASLAGRRLSPVSDIAEIEMAIDTANYQANERVERRIAEYFIREGKEPDIEWIYAAVQQGQREANVQVRQIEEEYDRSLSNQVALISKLSLISPAASFSLAATRLAKTDFGYQRGFILRAQRFQEEFIRFLAQIPDKQARIDPAKLPLFSYEGESFGESLSATMPYLVVLLLSSGVIIFLSFVLFLRYDVR